MESKETLIKKTTWINCIDEFAEPKKYVALPVSAIYKNEVVILDAFGERNIITVRKSNQSTKEQIKE